MADEIRDAKDGLSTRLSTISGLRVLDYAAGSVNEFPSAVVLFESRNAAETLGGSTFAGRIKVILLVSAANTQEAFDTLDEFMDPLGTKSIEAAVDADATWGGNVDDGRLTSKSTYGERTKSIEARWTREVDVAQATAGSRRDRKKDPKTVLNIVVPNGSKACLMLILHRHLSDRVTVSYSSRASEGAQPWRIDITPFLNAGIPGILLAWFMFRLERILDRFDRTVQLMARALIRLLEREDSELASRLSRSLSDVNGEEA